MSVHSVEEIRSEIDTPIDDLSQICIENIKQQRSNSKMFYCPYSTPNFWHQVMLFETDYLPTDVSIIIQRSLH